MLYVDSLIIRKGENGVSLIRDPIASWEPFY